MIIVPSFEFLTEKNYTEDAHNHTSCHHELANGEIWVGNTSGEEDWTKGVEIPLRFRCLKSVRLGKQAYDVYGNPISRNYCLPLIIHESDEKEFEKLQSFDFWQGGQTS